MKYKNIHYLWKNLGMTFPLAENNLLKAKNNLKNESNSNI